VQLVDDPLMAYPAAARHLRAASEQSDEGVALLDLLLDCRRQGLASESLSGYRHESVAPQERLHVVCQRAVPGRVEGKGEENLPHARQQCVPAGLQCAKGMVELRGAKVNRQLSRTRCQVARVAKDREHLASSRAVGQPSSTALVRRGADSALGAEQHPHLNDDQRARLAVRAKALGCSILEAMATIVTSDTLLRRRRQLVAAK